MPIIVMSMRDDERAKVRALDLGADDYVAKPFAGSELLARVRAAFRHRFQAQGEAPNFVSGDLVVDLVRRVVRVSGRPVALTPLEYRVLSVFVRYAGRVLTHRQLTRAVWDEDKPASLQPLRVAINGLRRKIEANPNRPMHIVTETRIGYRLTVIEGAACDSPNRTETVAAAGGGFGIAATAEPPEAASKQKDAQSQLRKHDEPRYLVARSVHAGRHWCCRSGSDQPPSQPVFAGAANAAARRKFHGDKRPCPHRSRPEAARATARSKRP
jgi:DNA-binding winged helix-turn-helix (wHTH) protein